MINEEFNNGEVAEAVSVPPPVAQDNYDNTYGNDAQTFDQENPSNQEGNDVEGHHMFDKDAAAALVFENGGYPLIVFLCSVVALVASSTKCGDGPSCTGVEGWAVAASVVSTVVSLGYLVLDKKGNLEPKMQLIVTLFLFAWWVAFAGVATFKGPFTIPGNGYFACWGGLIATSVMMVNSVGKVRESVDKFAALGYKAILAIVGSVVVWCAGITYAGSGLGNYAIAAGIISMVFFIGRIVAGPKLSANMQKYFAMFMIVWWLVGMFILTFWGPFDNVGNGYFATWACLIASILLLE